MIVDRKIEQSFNSMGHEDGSLKLRWGILHYTVPSSGRRVHGSYFFQVNLF